MRAAHLPICREGGASRCHPAQEAQGLSLPPLLVAAADLLVCPPLPAAPPEVEELWIGLNDLKLQMNFEWSDGSLVSFTHWHPFEPNNFRDSLEDCVTIWGPVRTPLPITGSQYTPSLPVLFQPKDVLLSALPITPPHCLSEAPSPPSPLPTLHVERLPGFESPLHLQLAGSP